MEFITRDLVLGGMPAKRAQTLLYLIENRTAELCLRDRCALEPFNEAALQQEEALDFIEAFSSGRLPIEITIQFIERYAMQWAHLLPDNVQIRAALAHILGKKYVFARSSVPNLRSALALDSDAVQQAYQRLYDAPLSAIYAPAPPARDRARWAWTRVSGWFDNLSPFWTAFALTLTETVGAGILALPIAIASIGPLAGLVVLVVLGVVNQLTIAALAESFSRSGSVRYGDVYVRGMVAEYLGAGSARFLVSILGVVTFIILIAYYIGVSTQLEHTTGLPAAAWIVVIALICTAFATRKSLTATVTLSLIVGFTNLGLLLLLMLVALPHVTLANLSYVNLPFMNGSPFDPSLLGLIFGVVLASYYGHTTTVSAAKVVLRRDPSARALMYGSVSAQIAAMILYGVWILVINGALSHEVLEAQNGTALGALTTIGGPVVAIAGTLLIILAPGVASLHVSRGLFNLVREQLPVRRDIVIRLKRRHGQLTFHGRKSFALGLTYLGADGANAQFRIDAHMSGSPHSREISVSQQWDAAGLTALMPALHDQRPDLLLMILQADELHCLVRVITPMQVSYEGGWDSHGIDLAGLLDLLPEQRHIVNWIMRAGQASAADVAAETGEDVPTVQARLDTLVQDSYLRELTSGNGARYQVVIAPRRGRELSDKTWHAIGTVESLRVDAIPAAVKQNGRRAAARRYWESFGERERLLVGVIPIMLALLVAQVIIAGQGLSFTRLVGIAGVIAAVTFAGTFPILLLVATRRKGDLLPPVTARPWTIPVTVTLGYLFFIVSCFANGLVVMTNPAEQIAITALGVLLLALTADMFRRKRFAPRLVVSIQEDLRPDGKTTFSIVRALAHVAGKIQLDYIDGRQETLEASAGTIPDFTRVHQITVQLPIDKALTLKVWLYRILPSGDTESIPGFLKVTHDATTLEYDLKLSRGQAVVPILGAMCEVQLELPSAQ